MTLKDYFKGDEMAADVWLSKYAIEGEETPHDMHVRMANELARVEKNQTERISTKGELSEFGEKLYEQKKNGLTTKDIIEYFAGFQYIVPQGSIMTMLGNKYKIGSLSNCFVIPSPVDSYGGILRTDQQLVQLMKRRGGVGLNINTLRPSDTPVSNAAGTSTGAVSFMHRYSNSTREVAQNGRRGALMLLISCRHPDVFKFVNVKKDRTQVTGANISVMLTDSFMEAVEKDGDFYCTFPIERSKEIESCFPIGESPYNQLLPLKSPQGDGWVMRIKAKELFDQIVENAWDNAEPGLAFMDRVVNYSPDGVYPEFRPVASNPCFHPDTVIETVKGRMKIKDIIEPTQVYSMDEDGKLCIRRATNAFVTKRNAKTLKITLGSGNSIQVTPDHKLYVHDEGWLEAQDIVIGMRIAHLCRSRRGAVYSGVHLTTDPRKKEGQVMEHRLVAGVTDETVDVHHMNRNTYDNRLENLLVLSHEEHCVVTATEDNPQSHQIRNNSNGRFITHENSRKGEKTIIDIPEELKTGMKNQFSNCVVSIEDGEITDVYDIQVEGTHCLIAENMVAHNCGEQWMQAYDACRLLAINLFSIVKNPFTDSAEIDYDKLYEVAYIQQRLADNIVDLEIEYVNRIIKKIKNDPEPMDIKVEELSLWDKVKKTAEASRRTGCGFTALGDMLAAVGVKYDSEEALSITEMVMKTKMRAELDCTIDLAILRGTFQGWDNNKEFSSSKNTIFEGKNDFYEMLIDDFRDQSYRMMKYGRRNVSWSTVAPTGSVSILTQTTSGLEPLFLPFYMRRKKVNPSDKNVRIDFVDQNGDSWTEYPIIHPKFKDWIEQTIYYSEDKMPFEEWILKQDKSFINLCFEKSPWYKSTANDISWEKRVKIQAVIQRFTTNAISSTLNLPNNVSKETVASIYLSAWKAGLKGVTIYRDGCRTGVLVAETGKKSSFDYTDAIKRPKEIDGVLHVVTVKGIKYGVIVGLMDGKPYELFAFNLPSEVKDSCNGKIVKVKKGHYNFECEDGSMKNLQEAAIKNDELVLTRLVSGMLRHGAKPQFVMEQIDKCDLEVVSFGKAVSRVLKRYVKDEEMVSRNTCKDCNSSNVRMQEGCLTCLDCGQSRCG